MALKDWWLMLTGRPADPHGRNGDQGDAADFLGLPPVPTGAELLCRVSALDADITERARSGGVSGVVVARVHQICSTASDVIPRLSELGRGSRDAHAVMATVTSYLPEALGTYLRLPRQYADTRPVAGGKTSLMVLVDQLDLLAFTMDKILDAATRRDVDALVAHGTFLEDKFGTGSRGGRLDTGQDQSQ